MSLVRLFSVLLCLSTARLVSSGDTDTPTPPPDPVKAIEITHKILPSGSAVLSCIVKDLGRRRIIWSRLADPFPISVGTMRFHPNKKYRVENKANTNILTIRRVSISDAGEYQCKVGGGEFPLTETISLNIQSGPNTPYFLATNRSVVSAVGLTATLPCEVENLNSRMVLWKDDCNNVITLRKREYKGDKRISVIHDTRPQWHLKIENLEEKDFGHYTCVVNSDPVLTRTVHLINQEPPKFAPVLVRDTNFRSKFEVNEDETVTLTCNFHSYPPATINWYKRIKENNKTQKIDLGAVGSEYTLRSVRVDQAGDYICVARNGMKQEGKAKTRLIVQARPTTIATTLPTTTFVPTSPTAPHVFHKGNMIGQRRGRDAILRCFAIGHPRPNIHWRRHKIRIVNDHKHRLKEERERYTTHSTLTVRSVSSRDFGSYECVAYSELGLTNITLSLYETRN